jgi:hypothetical protein
MLILLTLFVFFVRAMLGPQQPQIHITVALSVEGQQAPEPELTPQEIRRLAAQCVITDWEQAQIDRAARSVRVVHGARPGQAALVDGATGTIVRR